MTYEPSRSVEHLPPPPEQAQEGISWFAVLGTGSAALLIFTIATFVVYGYLQNREKALQPEGPDPIPMILGQPEIGIVDQVPFDVTRSFQAYKLESLERLSSWGWMDKQKGTVHMPIDRAMELVVQQQKEEKK
jgi:hypothetical protein